MKSKKSKLSIMLCVALTACTFSLSGCGTLEPEAQATGAQAFGHLTQTTESYAELADKSSGDGRFNALILLARSQITQGNFDGATETLTELNDSVTNPLQKDEASIISALLLSKNGNNEAAAKMLSTVNSQAMSESLARYYYLLGSSVNEKAFLKTKQDAYAQAAYVNSASLLPLVSGEDRKTVARRTVTFLEASGSKSLMGKLASSGSDFDRGFYEYVTIDSSSSADAKSKLFADFKNRYSSHPLSELIDNSSTHPIATGDEVEAQNVPTSPQMIAVSGKEGEAVPVKLAGIFNLSPDAKVAVLLPLSGRYARTVGESAKLGIMASLQDHKSKLQVTFYDTAKEQIGSIYETLQTNGTALIIGPIIKDDLNALNALNPNIPIIALNTPENSRPTSEWYFDLSPDYEGALAAAKIKADGFKAPIVVVASDRSAQRASQGFVKSFGTAAKVCNITDPSKGSQAARGCDTSGIDAAYIAGSAVDAVNFKAGLPANLQVYLTDSSYEGFNNSGQQLALNGAKLGDMPWLLSDSTLKDSFMNSIPKANSQAQRIFCAGYDAVSLGLSMSELAKDSLDVLHGLTGDISLGQNGLIESAPLWVSLGEIRN